MRILGLIFIMMISQNALSSDSVFMVPGKSWGFQFSSPDLVYHEGNITDSGYKFEASTNVGFIISAYVEPASGKGTNSKECMKYYFAMYAKNPSIKKDTIKVVAVEPFAVVSYLIDAESKGQRFIQPNTNYFGFRDGSCIDVHVSQVFPFEKTIDYSNMINFGKTFDYYK